MAETLFPQRQRCKKCRSNLGSTPGTPVYLGLYCSARCAGRSAVPTAPTDAPRECTTTRDGATVFKRRYRSVAEIPDRIRDDFSTSHYWCGACHSLHVGHSRLSGPEPLRMLGSPDELADVLIKLRGKATRTQVAKAAGVKPIRLKELEEPARDQRVDLAVLYAVLRVLQAGLGVQIRQKR